MILGLLTLAAFTWLLCRDSEPSFDGHSLSYWAGFYSDESQDRYGSPELRAAATDALRHIGTNALPHLLKWLDYDPRPWRADQIIRHVRLSLTTSNPSLRQHLSRDPRLDRFNEATFALLALGPQARPAMPDLVRMLNETNSFDFSTPATSVLVGIGDDAIPALTAATSPQSPNRQRILSSISLMATNQTVAAIYAPIAPTLPTMASNVLFRIAPERSTNVSFQSAK